MFAVLLLVVALAAEPAAAVTRLVTVGAGDPSLNGVWEQSAVHNNAPQVCDCVCVIVCDCMCVCVCVCV